MNWRRNRQREGTPWPTPSSATPSARRSAATAARSPSVRADDLAAVPLTALMERNPRRRLGEGRRRDLRLRQPGRRGQPQRRPHGGAAGRPAGDVPGTTINRLCGSGMDAVGQAARAIRAGEADLMIAGGVESMTRAPFVMPKAESAFSRANAVYDTTIGWRFVNPKMKQGLRRRLDAGDGRERRRRLQHQPARTRTPSPPAARPAGPRRRRPAASREEIVPVTIPQKKGEPIVVADDEHPAAGHHARGAGEAQGRQRPGRHRHRRQRLGRQRRRRALLVIASEAAAERARPDAEGARRRHGRRRRRAADHGHRPGARGAQGAGARRPQRSTRWT